MSYTVPHRESADATWAGAQAPYTPPHRDSADATWQAPTTVKVFSGGAWVPAVTKVWGGTSWLPATVKRL